MGAFDPKMSLFPQFYSKKNKFVGGGGSCFQEFFFFFLPFLPYSFFSLPLLFDILYIYMCVCGVTGSQAPPSLPA